MSVISSVVRRFLGAPLIQGVDVDGIDRLAAHRQILAQKKMLRQVFREFHHKFDELDRLFLDGNGLRLELGAGIAPIRDSFPDVLATDVVDHPSEAALDCVLDAENLDLSDSSVRVVFGQNCFHHFPDPERFFGELRRVLVPNGGAILLEPYYGWFASFLYPRLFSSEGYDKDFPSWKTPQKGPMHGANQALSYVVFVRDRHLFETLFPDLQIVHQYLMPNYLKYLFSGGLNFRQLWPDGGTPVLSFLQCLLMPLRRILSLHHVVVIKKISP
jgi:SAM-dependent methyltransferase